MPALAAAGRAPVLVAGHTADVEARKRDGAVVLLGPVDAVRKPLVDEYPVDLGRGLIVHGGPRLASVLRHLRATVVADHDGLRIVRVEPQVVRVAVWDPDALEGPAAVDRFPEAHVQGVDRVLVHRVGVNVRVVPGPLPELAVRIHLRPRVAPVVRAVHAAVLPGRLYQGPHAVGVRRRDRDGRLPHEPVRQPTLQALPRISPIDAPVDAAFLSAADHRPRLSLGPPHSGEQDPRIARVHSQVHGPGAVTDEQNPLPARPAVAGPEHSALRVRTERVSERCHESHIRVPRVNDDPPDLSRFRQTDVRPGAAAVHRAVDPISLRRVAADAGRAHAHPYDVVVRVGHVDGPDGSRTEEFVGDVFPVHARVHGLPHSSARASHVERQGLLGDSRHGGHASSALRPQRTVLER